MIHSSSPRKSLPDPGGTRAKVALSAYDHLHGWLRGRRGACLLHVRELEAAVGIERMRLLAARHTQCRQPAGCGLLSSASHVLETLLPRLLHDPKLAQGSGEELAKPVSADAAAAANVIAAVVCSDTHTGVLRARATSKPCSGVVGKHCSCSGVAALRTEPPPSCSHLHRRHRHQVRLAGAVMSIVLQPSVWRKWSCALGAGLTVCRTAQKVVPEG